MPFSVYTFRGVPDRDARPASTAAVSPEPDFHLGQNFNWFSAARVHSAAVDPTGQTVPCPGPSRRLHRAPELQRTDVRAEDTRTASRLMTTCQGRWRLTPRLRL